MEQFILSNLLFLEPVLSIRTFLCAERKKEKKRNNVKIMSSVQKHIIKKYYNVQNIYTNILLMVYPVH